MNITPRISYIISAFISMFLGAYFAYKGFLAYFIHKELYGGGIDALVASRWGLAAALILLSFLFLFFIRIKDLKSHKTILNGIFICWASVCVTLLIVATSSIYFIVLTGLASLISLVSSKGLVKKIKEERETLSEKEVYLLQQLAKKK